MHTNIYLHVYILITFFLCSKSTFRSHLGSSSASCSTFWGRPNHSFGAECTFGSRLDCYAPLVCTPRGERCHRREWWLRRRWHCIAAHHEGFCKCWKCVPRRSRGTHHFCECACVQSVRAWLLNQHIVCLQDCSSEYGEAAWIRNRPNASSALSPAASRAASIKWSFVQSRSIF